MHNQPDVIFFDAVGTLFGVKGSVGQIYGAIAAQYEVEVDHRLLDQAFLQNFKSAPRMAFSAPDSPSGQAIAYDYEYQWWRSIAQNTFEQVGAFNLFKDFAAYFQDIYAFFSTAEAWYIYADVVPILEHLQQQGITLGIISNFDHRLFAVLKDLHLGQFFDSVTISTQAGAAKPDSQIFQKAIAKHAKYLNFWHIGDSFNEDFQGATKAGITGIWLDRDGQTQATTIRSFEDLRF